MKIVGVIIGGLLILVALPFLAVGIGIVGWLGDGSGLNIPLNGIDAPKKVVAIVSPEFSVDAADIPTQVADASVTFQVTPKPGGAPIFVGLAAAKDVDRYLRNVTIAHLESVDQGTSGTAQAPAPQDIASGDGTDVQLVVEPGSRTRVAPPKTRDFWVRQADTSTGDITLSVADLDGSDVRIVVMRTDGRPGMAVDASMTFRVPILKTVGWWVLGIGIAMGLIGVGLLLWMILLLGRPKHVTPTGATTDPAPAAPAAADDDRPAVDTTPTPPDAPADSGTASD
jgi:hypothetical protein